MEWEKTLTIKSATGKIQVRYFVLPQTTSPMLEKPCFGIGIEEGGEVLSVPFFSPNRELTLHTAKKLAAHRVTPVSFFEIMDDFLGADPF